MGNILSPSSSKRSEIEAFVDSILVRVSKEYVTAYGSEFLKEQLEEDELNQQLNQDGTRDYQLRFRPFFSFSDRVCQGFVRKQGVVVKNWKRRFLVVHPDYVVDYYEAEEDFWRGKKPKGSINADGYNVVDNATAYAQSKRQETASLLGGEPRNCPTAEEYSDTTFVVAHVRRRPYFIQADSMEEKERWVQVFRRCCRYANGRTCRDSRVGIAAFDVALRNTYWSRGQWTYPDFGGTEEQILSDLVLEELNPVITQEIQEEIPTNLPWAIKTKMCVQAIKGVHSLVTTKARNVYEEMQTTVTKMRTRLESIAEEKREEIVCTRERLTDAIRKKVWEELSSEMTSRTPQIAALIETIKPVMADALMAARGVFEKEAAAVVERVRTMSGTAASREETLATIWRLHFLTLDYVPRRAWQLKETFSRLAGLRAVLENFIDTFPDMPSGQVESLANRIMTLMLDAAIFTFEGLFVEHFDETVENPLRSDGDGVAEVAASILNNVLAETLQMWEADIDLTLEEFCEKCVACIVVPEVRKKFDPLHQPIVDLVSREVPIAIRCVLCVRYQYEDLVEESVVETVNKVLKGGDDTRL